MKGRARGIVLEHWHRRDTGPRKTGGLCCVFLLYRVWLFMTPWSVAHQASLSMEFSRQEYWSGLPCPPPGDLPGPGVKRQSSAGRFFTVWTTREALEEGATKRSCPGFWIISLQASSVNKSKEYRHSLKFPYYWILPLECVFVLKISNVDLLMCRN